MDGRRALHSPAVSLNMSSDRTSSMSADGQCWPHAFRPYMYTPVSATHSPRLSPPGSHLWWPCLCKTSLLASVERRTARQNPDVKVFHRSMAAAHELHL
eukprot:6510891-Prymnesium_polylepis.3